MTNQTKVILGIIVVGGGYLLYKKSIKKGLVGGGNSFGGCCPQYFTKIGEKVENNVIWNQCKPMGVISILVGDDSIWRACRTKQ